MTVSRESPYSKLSRYTWRSNTSLIYSMGIALFFILHLHPCHARTLLRQLFVGKKLVTFLLILLMLKSSTLYQTSYKVFWKHATYKVFWKNTTYLHNLHNPFHSWLLGIKGENSSSINPVLYNIKLERYKNVGICVIHKSKEILNDILL